MTHQKEARPYSKAIRLLVVVCSLLCLTTTLSAAAIQNMSASSASTRPRKPSITQDNLLQEESKKIPLKLKGRSDTLIRSDPIYIWSSLVAGVGSGALASVICAPLDLVRTRMQVWGEVTSKQRASIPQIYQEIIAKEGWKGCFRGLGATLLTVPTFWGVYFPLYDTWKRRFTREHPDVNPALIHMSSAVLAGGVSDVICNPMFVVRTRLQTEALHNMMDKIPSKNKMSILQTTKSLYFEGGVFIFWRGMTANLMGLSHVAVQFPVYEGLKKTMRSHKHQESAVDLLVASGLSKMTASLLTYPHEVIRSRMMDARTGAGFFQTCQRIYAAEGAVGFYAGLPVSLMRVIPNTCITFLTYEYFLRWARSRILEYRKLE